MRSQKWSKIEQEQNEDFFFLKTKRRKTKGMAQEEVCWSEQRKDEQERGKEKRKNR